MSEEENVAEDPLPQEVVQPTEEQAQDVSSEETPVESDQERNWRRMRESNRQLEDEVSELRRYVEEAKRAKQPEPAPEADDLAIADDDLVEGRHVKKLMHRMESMMRKQEAKSVPDRLKSRFPDFDDVVTVENVERLKKEEPELLASIQANPDIYNKGVAAYRLMTKYGKKEDPYAREKASLESNKTRPGSAHAAAKQSPLAEADTFANGLTPALRKQLLAEMEEATRRL